MPNGLHSIDLNFPTFTGEETAEQQIRAMHNYLYQLREGLRYSLQNLTADNFNATALQKLTDEQKDGVTAELQKVYGLLGDLRTEVDSISGKVTGTENFSGRLTAVEESASYLEEEAAAARENITDLQLTVSFLETDVSELLERADDIEDRLQDLEQAADDLDALEVLVAGSGGLKDRMDAAEGSLQALAGAVRVAEDGSVTIGAAGSTLNLAGTIYINGILYEQGGTT